MLILIYRGRNIYEAGDVKNLAEVKWQGQDLNPGKDLLIQ